MTHTPSPTRSPDRWFTVLDGVRLRQLRHQHGLSAAELAGKAGVGLSTVIRLERHHQRPCRTLWLVSPPRWTSPRPPLPAASRHQTMQPADAPAGSAVPRRVLGHYLRDLRQQAGFTVKLAARLMEWSEPKMWRIETGQTAIRALDVQAMCVAYGAAPGQPGHWPDWPRKPGFTAGGARYGEAIPDDFGIYTALEDAASGLAGYAPGQVPGLLRTEAYARTLITSTGLSGREAA
jgi:transcriptional regulator with XRE-family HTH domain